MTKTRRGIPLRFYFGLLFALVVCSAAVSVVYLQEQSSRDARRQAHADAAFAATAAAKALNGEIAAVRGAVDQLAANPSIVQALVHPAGCSLTFGAPGGPEQGHLDILNLKGEAFCSSRARSKNGTLPGYAGASWLHRAAVGPVFLAPAPDAVTGRSVALYAAPVSGKAIVAGFLDLNTVAGTLEETYGGGRSPEFLVAANATGKVIARSIEPSRWIGTSLAGTPFAPTSTGVTRRDLNGTQRIYADAVVPDLGWKLYVGENEQRALAAGTRLRNRELLIILTSLALFLLVTLFVYRRTVVPMRRLSLGVERTAAQGHDHTVAVSGSAEVRGLATEVNALIASVNAQEAVRRAKEEAERANEAKTRFLSHMSHEFRTPLAAILGFAELLNTAAVDEKQRSWSGYVLDGGRHLLQLVNELLEISRIESGMMMLTSEPVDVGQTVAEVLQLVGPLADERGIRLESATTSEAAPYALADPLRLKQVLLNLVSNAIKYNIEAGRVTVRTTETTSGRVCVTVVDTGKGIPADDLEKLYKPFERLDADASQIVGSGLGLVVTKGLVDAMNGRLDVESELGVGTTFTIELPRADAVELDRTPPVGIATAGDVLYIDDNPANLALLERVFGEFRPGVLLRTSGQGVAGVDLADQRRPDLLLLDLNLPDIPGEEVLRRLRARPENVDVPVMILSADSTSRNITRLLQSGADAYLTKPFDVPHFLEVVDRLLAGQRGSKATRPPVPASL
jgi:signal transduction histidine kinase/ActR/RegA family two-component response regulator